MTMSEWFMDDNYNIIRWKFRLYWRFFVPLTKPMHWQHRLYWLWHGRGHHKALHDPIWTRK